MATRNLLAEPRSAGNEDAWKTLVTQFPPKTTPPAAAAVLACWRVPPKREVEIPPRVALTMSTPRCSSTPSAPAAPSQTPGTTVNNFLTCKP